MDNQAVLYLVDDDNPPTISITDNSTSNENAGATNLIVTLSASSSKTVTVDYNSIDATASSGALIIQPSRVQLHSIQGTIVPTSRLVF